MLILWVDDSSSRAAIAYQRMSVDKRNSVMWCRTAAEAISILGDPKYREELVEVYLDHDLEGPYYQNTLDSNCGMEVVRFIEKQNSKEFEHILFTIQSWNGFASQMMKEHLEKLGLKVTYKPFGT